MAELVTYLYLIMVIATFCGCIVVTICSIIQKEMGEAKFWVISATFSLFWPILFAILITWIVGGWKQSRSDYLEAKKTLEELDG